MKNTWEKAHAWVIFLYYPVGFAGLILITHPAILIAVFGILLVDACMTQGVKKALSILLTDLGFAVLITGFNWLVNHRGPTLITTLWGMRLTEEALLYGLQMALFFLVSLRLFMAYSRAMTDEKILALMGKRLPGLALLFSMILRLVPQVKQDAGSFRRLHGRSPRVFSALVNKTLEDGIVQSISMHDRGYQSGRKRTCFYRRRMRIGDVLAVTGICLWIAGCVLFAIYGELTCRYFPTIRIDSVPWYVWVLMCLYFSVPVIRRIMGGLTWRISQIRSSGQPAIAMPTPELRETH